MARNVGPIAGRRPGQNPDGDIGTDTPGSNPGAGGNVQPPANGLPPGSRVPPVRATGPGGVAFGGGPTPGSTAAVGGQSAGYNLVGKTPFMETPGMQIASQQENGDNIKNDPAISAAMSDFVTRTQPGIQNQSNLSGLGRSTANLNAIAQAQSSMLEPLYQNAMQRQTDRTNRMGAAAENELGRDERSDARVSDANLSMSQLLAQMSQNQFNNQQTTGQNMMNAGGQLRDISQQGNTAEQQDYLRRQALAENAVGMPFGGLASGGLGSITNTAGK